MQDSTHILTSQIPNWERFVSQYSIDDTLADALANRLTSIEDRVIRDRLIQYINLELGILLMSHGEIDQGRVQDILQILGGDQR